jgi:fatty acid desaturase
VIFPFQLHIAALRLATPRQARWIVAELAPCAGSIGLAIVASQPLLWYQVVSMTIGQMLSGFFAVWTVHHDCDRWQQIASTLRHRLKSAASFGMFYHLEHHLFPRVPTRRLPVLAERLDRAVPDIPRQQVF